MAGGCSCTLELPSCGCYWELGWVRGLASSQSRLPQARVPFPVRSYIPSFSIRYTPPSSPGEGKWSPDESASYGEVLRHLVSDRRPRIVALLSSEMLRTDVTKKATLAPGGYGFSAPGGDQRRVSLPSELQTHGSCLKRLQREGRWRGYGIPPAPRRANSLHLNQGKPRPGAAPRCVQSCKLVLSPSLKGLCQTIWHSDLRMAVVSWSG